MFFSCKIFSSIWYECLKLWGLAAPPHDKCADHFLQFSGLCFGNGKQRQCWEVVWFVVIWVIWNKRNAVMFRGASLAQIMVVDYIQEFSVLVSFGKLVLEPMLLFGSVFRE